jgi:hypothetical protein
MAFKMKASGYGNNPMKKNFPSAFKQDDGIISKVKNKIKKFANESTFFNPRSSAETSQDQMDNKMYTRLSKDYRAKGNKNTKEDKAYLDFYKAKTDSISKGLRPNKINRY